MARPKENADRSLGEMIAAVRDFVGRDLWRIRARELPQGKSILLRYLRIVVLSLRGFHKDNCMLRATALTFWTLLSIPSVLGMFFGIAKGFGFEKILERQVLKSFPGQELAVGKVIEFAKSVLENAQGGVMAGVGLLVLFWSVLKVMGHIEAAFNHIWEIQTSRSWGRKFSDYLAIMIISPVLVLLSSSAAVFIKTQVEQMADSIPFFGYLSSGIYFMLRFTPFFLIWVLFTLIYLIMPNTKVQLRAGVLAGVVAGTIYMLAQMVYLGFQIGTARASAIYGSFAALPLLLVWIQVSWMIVLFGAELAFANQNVHTYEYEPDCLETSPSFRQLVALQIVHQLVKNLVSNGEPLTAAQISANLETPLRLVNHLLFDLSASGILVETKTDSEKESGFVPARDINTLTISSVLEALSENGFDAVPVSRTDVHDQLSASLEQLRSAAAASPANLLLKDL
jgi:membrane protein